MREIDVAAVTAVADREARDFEVEGQEIVFCNVEGRIYALQGMCTHQDRRWTAARWRTAS